MPTSRNGVIFTAELEKEFNEIEKLEDKVQYLRSKDIHELEYFKSYLEKKIAIPVPLVEHYEKQNPGYKEKYLNEVREKINLVKKVIGEFA